MVSYLLNRKYTDVMLLAVRFLLAFELLWHGVPKLLDPAAAADQFVGWGFPGILGPIVGNFRTNSRDTAYCWVLDSSSGPHRIGCH